MKWEKENPNGGPGQPQSERVPGGVNGRPARRIGVFAHGNRLAGPQEPAALRPDGVAPQAVLRRLAGIWPGRERSGRVSFQEVRHPNRGAESPPSPPRNEGPRLSGGDSYPEKRKITSEKLSGVPVIVSFGDESILVIPDNVTRPQPSGEAPGISLYAPIGGQLLARSTSERTRVGRVGDVRIEGSTVSRYHAEFQRGPDGWTLEDTSKNGTFIEEIPQIVPGDTLVPVPSGQWRHISASGDITVHLGEDAFATIDQASGGRERYMRDKWMAITPLLPCGTPKHFGRSPKNDIQLTEPTVSWRHGVVIALADGTYLVHDQGSRNGTQVSVIEPGQYKI